MSSIGIPSYFPSQKGPPPRKGYKKQPFKKPSRSTKLKTKMGGSKTVNKEKKWQGVEVAPGHTMSHYWYPIHRLPLGARQIVSGVVNKNFQVLNNGFRIAAGVGKQEVSAQGIFDTSDLNTLFSNLGATPHSKRAIFLNASVEALIKNQSQIHCRIWIYDIIPRSDITNSNSLYTYPDGAWKTSYTDQSSTNTNYQVPGALPYSSALFTQQYIVKKVTNFVIDPGACHIHRVRVTPNKVMDREKIYNTATYGLWKDVSAAQMFVVHGMPDNDSTTKTSVSTGNCAIDIVFKKEYRYSYLQDNDSNFYATNSLPTTYGVAEEAIIEATGAVSNAMQLA